MDEKIDPKAPPLSAEELAKDFADSPHDADGPPLRKAEDSSASRSKGVDPSAISIGSKD